MELIQHWLHVVIFAFALLTKLTQSGSPSSYKFLGIINVTRNDGENNEKRKGFVFYHKMLKWL